MGARCRHLAVQPWNGNSTTSAGILIFLRHHYWSLEDCRRELDHLGPGFKLRFGEVLKAIFPK